MSEHTPGPWTADPQHDPLRPWEFHIYAGLEESDEGYNGGHIATATGGDPDINKANARLIAAAPEMLALIKGLVQWIEDNSPDTEWCDQLAPVRTLLARLEG